MLGIRQDGNTAPQPQPCCCAAARLRCTGVLHSRLRQGPGQLPTSAKRSGLKSVAPLRPCTFPFRRFVSSSQRAVREERAMALALALA